MNESDISPADPTVSRVVAMLDQGARELDTQTLARLYAGRRQAVASAQGHQAATPVLVLRRHPVWAGLALASALLVMAWMALESGGRGQPAPLDTGELDIQLLTGELPPQVFADWSLVTRENVEAVCLTDS